MLPKKKIAVTESYAEIKLQSLIDHTILRLYSSYSDFIKNHISTYTEIFALFKWGCDGSNQSLYKQKWIQEGSSDENLFSISLVLVQIYLINKNEEKIIIYENKTPNSSRYCRPIKLIFAKETTDLIKKRSTRY